MSEKQPPLQIRSLADATEWLEHSFKWNKESRANYVLLRQNVVLCWVSVRDIHSSHTFGQWRIVNVKNEILAQGTHLLSSTMAPTLVDENSAAMELWRACLAWGPGKDPEVEYIYFTTFVDDDGQQEDDTRNIGRAPMPHDDASRKGMPTAKDWELVSTNIAPVRGRDDVLAGPKRERARIYYHWRRAVR